jgi:hypothetical protein
MMMTARIDRPSPKKRIGADPQNRLDATALAFFACVTARLSGRGTLNWPKNC